LRAAEQWWARRYDWLEERGYKMRPRYRPGWKASWLGQPHSFDSQPAEDSLVLPVSTCMDALRVSDSQVVAMKHVKSSSDEAQVCQMFSSQEHTVNLANHCIPLLKVLKIPEFDEIILVMPWMCTVKDPPFRTIGEVLPFFQEMLQGLQYMHHNNVAHRDCSINNMVMDARTMFSDQYHPADLSMKYDWSGEVSYASRTCHPPRYYLIDFGFSKIYDSGKERPLEEPIMSGGYMPPEGESDTPCDPFMTDVFLVGNMMLKHFIDLRSQFGIHGLKFLRPLAKDMVWSDPSKRPTIDQVVNQFSALVKKISSRKL
ncbi:kinase-like domain-containing protein, partial [Lentinula aff. lateritia]